MEVFILSFSQKNSSNNNASKCPSDVNCEVKAKTQTQFPDTPVTPVVNPNLENVFIKVPLVLAETTLQVVVEADIPLNPPAVEIKRILKDVEIEQCKLVPIGPFVPIDATGFFTSDGAKLFISGFIRKNIEYAAKGCNGSTRTTTARVPFSGFADLSGNLLNPPIFGFGDQRRAQFINPKTGESPRFDKFFFQNSVFYNEQPFCELISAEFFELDFSPHALDVCKSFDTLREKIVLDLTLKVLQTQQVPLNGTASSRSED